MAVELFGEDAPEAGTRVAWQHGGQEIGLELRPVPAAVRRRYEQRVTGSVKTRKFNDQPLSRTGEQAQKIAALCAAYALLDSDGFELLTKSAEVVAEMNEAGVAMEAGKPVCLDGKWSDKVKAVIFDRLPTMASFVVDAAEKLAGIERDQEADLGKT